MYYSEFVFKAEKLTINLLENGVWYLEPEWKDILYRNDMGDLENLTDSFLSGWDDVEDILKLEVEKRNARRWIGSTTSLPLPSNRLCSKRRLILSSSSSNSGRRPKRNPKAGKRPRNK